MLSDFVGLLARLPDIPYRSPFSFRRNTTVGIGGEAPLALFPRGGEEIVSALREVQRAGFPYVLLGRGSNVLVSDGGFDGVVIATALARAIRAEDGLIVAECGVALSALLRFAAENDLGGLEYLAGIPASAGGAVFMNAGARGKYIGENVHRVTAFTDGEVCELAADQCDFAYKSTRFMRGGCILSVVLRAEPDAYAAEKIRAALAEREKLPRERSLGCVFKNPPGHSAGELIERAGLKGMHIGGAFVSEKHANFIVNRGEATAADYRALVALVRGKVLSETGIRLAEEIRYIGEFYASDG